MQRESFTNALRATAKIACAASLLHVSCKSKTPVEVATPNNSTVDTQEQNTKDPTEQTSPLGFPSEDTDPSDAEFSQCQPVVTDAFANDSFPVPDEISQEVKDCCALTAAYYDALGAKTTDFNIAMDWEHRDQCCSALEWSDGSRACTPWGPPTPPSAHKMKRSIVVRQRSLVS